MNEIILYRDEFTDDVWECYCQIIGVPCEVSKIIIQFNDNDVDYEY